MSVKTEIYVRDGQLYEKHVVAGAFYKDGELVENLARKNRLFVEVKGNKMTIEGIKDRMDIFCREVSEKIK